MPGASCPSSTPRRRRPRSLTCVTSSRTVTGAMGPTVLLQTSSCRQQAGAQVPQQQEMRCQSCAQRR